MYVERERGRRKTSVCVCVVACVTKSSNLTGCLQGPGDIPPRRAGAGGPVGGRPTHEAPQDTYGLAVHIQDNSMVILRMDI